MVGLKMAASYNTLRFHSGEMAAAHFVPQGMTGGRY
jgi:hypothetical protein